MADSSNDAFDPNHVSHFVAPLVSRLLDLTARMPMPVEGDWRFRLVWALRVIPRLVATNYALYGGSTPRDDSPGEWIYPERVKGIVRQVSDALAAALGPIREHAEWDRVSPIECPGGLAAYLSELRTYVTQGGRFAAFEQDPRCYDGMLTAADCLEILLPQIQTAIQVELSKSGVGDHPPSPHKATRLSLEAKALAVLTDHPEWNNKQIAEAVGCHVKSLHRLKRYKNVKAMMKDRRGTLPIGQKDGTTGSIEAWKRDREDE